MCNFILSLPYRWIFSVLAPSILLILALVPCARCQSAAAAGAEIKANALFARALAVSDLRAPGSPPFEMRATINIGQARHKAPPSGTYSLEWVSPEKWREEIHLAHYTRIRVGGKEQYWQSRTTSYELLPLFQLNRGLGFLGELHLWSNFSAMEELAAIEFHQKQAQGIDLDCVTLIPKASNLRAEYCFDPATGTLDSSGPAGFSNFMPFGSKYFPGNIRIEEKPADPVTFQVISISPLGSVNPEDFQSPLGSTVWPSCEAPLPAKIKSQVPPDYPMPERMSHVEGTVVVYALIGTDGRPTNLKVLSAPEPGLASSAFTAVEQWRYAPTSCGGTPIPVETRIDVVYALGP
jgi:TonB family protein